jgi:hypothetical protein
MGGWIARGHESQVPWLSDRLSITDRRDPWKRIEQRATRHAAEPQDVQPQQIAIEETPPKASLRGCLNITDAILLNLLS